MLHEVATTANVGTDILVGAQHLFNHLGDVLTGSVSALIFSAAVRALPKPEPLGSKLYQWFYVFTQNILANPDKAAGASATQAIVDRATDKMVNRVVND